MNNIAGALYRVIKIKNEKRNEMKCSRRMRSVSRQCSHTIVVFQYQTSWQYFDENPLNRGVDCRWGRQKSRF